MNKRSLRVVLAGVLLLGAMFAGTTDAANRTASATCVKGGYTTVSLNGDIDHVSMYWYKNNGAYITGTSDYYAPYRAWTPDSAKYVTVYVYFNGNQRSQILQVGCR